MFDWVVLKQEVMCDIQLTQMSCSCLRRTKQAHRGQQNVPTYRVGSAGQGYFLFYKKTLSRARCVIMQKYRWISMNQDLPWIQKEFEASLDCKMSPCVKKKKKCV